jgi:hypothetical protein
LDAEAALNADVADLVVRLLRGSDRPLSVHQLHKQLPQPFRPRKGDLADSLKVWVREGRIFAYGGGRGELYLDRSVEELARQQIAKVLNGGPLLLSELRRKVRLVPTSELDRLIEELRSAGQIFVHPPVSRSRSVRYSTRPVDPVDYLRDPVGAVWRKLADAGVSRGKVAAALRRLADELTTEEGESDRPTTGGGGAASELKAQVPGDDLPERILDRMKLVDPRADEGGMISLGDLRRLNAFQHEDREHFDRALWQLVREQRLAVHEHGSVGLLEEAERADCLVDGKGRYFHAVSRRARP